jgi:hypothetical protein
MRSLPILAIVLAGCMSSGSGYAELYEAPQGTATASMFGTWGGVVQGLDTRWVLSPGQITLANKCGSRIVGIDVAAEVTDSQIRILESDQSGGNACFVRSMPGTFSACSGDVFDPKDNCFDHDGKQLTIYASDVDFVALTKLTDATP